MAVKLQLYVAYHGDRYMWDRLKEAIEICEIQDTLRDRPARSSQQLIERVENKLSDLRKTVGAVY